MPNRMKGRSNSLRRLLDRGPLIAPGVPNALTARLVQQIGFPVVYLSGAGVSNNLLGVPDIGFLSRTEMVSQTQFVAQAVSIPIIVDCDTGFGGPLGVARTVREVGRAGAGAIQIEDQADPKRCGHLSGKKLISTEEMAAKIRAAVDARRSDELLIIARTDARTVEGLAAAIARAKAYREAGADLIFPEALVSIDEFRRFAKAVPGPLMANMTEFGQTPLISTKVFGELGYGLVIFPMTALRAMCKAAEDVLKELKRTGSQAKVLNRLQTRKELYRLVDYESYDRAEDRAARPGFRKGKK